MMRQPAHHSPGGDQLNKFRSAILSFNLEESMLGEMIGCGSHGREGVIFTEETSRSFPSAGPAFCLSTNGWGEGGGEADPVSTSKLRSGRCPSPSAMRSMRRSKLSEAGFERRERLSVGTARHRLAGVEVAYRRLASPLAGILCNCGGSGSPGIAARNGCGMRTGNASAGGGDLNRRMVGCLYIR